MIRYYLHYLRAPCLLIGAAVCTFSIGLSDGQLAADTDRIDTATSILSLHLSKPEQLSQQLPFWCRAKRESNTGPWHALSDDEYSNESPYLLCSQPFSRDASKRNPQLPSQRRAARAARAGECCSSSSLYNIEIQLTTWRASTQNTKK